MKQKASPPFVSYVNQILMAMPTLRDFRFERALVYICGHDAKGTMGLVINRCLPGLRLSNLLGQMNIPHQDPSYDPPVHFGGPMEIARGFVVHTTDYLHPGSIKLSDQVALTANMDILEVMGSKRRPQKSLLALGYSGWGSGQLDSEIRGNSWLQREADLGILFASDVERSWKRAFFSLGIDPGMLSEKSGHA